jgi:glycerophosphoryl diester phosphodiesterase
VDWVSIGGELRIGGHRGAPDVAPENTIAGFQAAFEAGVEYVEMDVRRTRDGHLVVIHDPRVERTTDGRGRVSQLTLEELRRLDAGRWFDERFLGTRVPTFAEFMTWMESHPGFGAVIEAKADGVGAEIADAIAASVARPHLSICSFKRTEIRAAKAAQPDVPCVLLFHSDRPSPDPVRETRTCRADGADLPWQWLTSGIVRDMHAAGLAVGGGTANDDASVELLMSLGADFVDSDRPAVAVAARGRRRGRA